MRGTLTEICSVECEQVAEVLRPQARRGIGRDRISRIKTYTRALQPIKEFEVANERGVREDISQVPNFAPAVGKLKWSSDPTTCESRARWFRSSFSVAWQIEVVETGGWQKTPPSR